jgi:hypothetical protein
MDIESRVVRRSFAVLLVAACVAAASPAHAASIGAQFGVDRSGVDGDVPPNNSYIDKYGLVAGLQGEIGFARDLSLSLQPSYVQKRSGLQTAASTPGGSPTERELAFDYISVPVLVKFSKAGGRTYVSGGVSVDFLNSAKLAGDDVKSTFNSSAFGAILGFGVVFPAGRSHLTTELRLVQGISNMNKGDIAAASGALAPRLHSTGFQLIFGGLLPVGKR